MSASSGSESSPRPLRKPLDRKSEGVEAELYPSLPVLRGSFSGSTWWYHIRVSAGDSGHVGLALGKDWGETYNLYYLTLALRAYQTMLVAIPLVGACMAKDNLAVAGGIEMALQAGVMGSHGATLLTALIRRQGS